LAFSHSTKQLRDNFRRIHKSLRVNPAMEAGITDHIWSLRELLA
jgi:hypothetical protein